VTQASGNRRKVELLLAGGGHVARRFIVLLEECRDALAAAGVEPVIVGVTTRRHGSVFDKAGLDAVRIARGLAKGDNIGPASSPSTLECIAQLRSQDVETRVLIETTTLDIRSGEPATSHVRAAIDAGAHVITANKGPVAFAYDDLAAAAAARGVRFLFEGAVMDGIPIFNLVRESMPLATIAGFRGVVNSTTNVLLSAIEATNHTPPRWRACRRLASPRRIRRSTSTVGTPPRRRRRWQMSGSAHGRIRTRSPATR
jgi:homoserine dehydrogenase